MAGWDFLHGLNDDQDSFAPTPGGVLDGLPKLDIGSSLHWLIDPKDVATIEGLPQHVYDAADKYGQQVAQEGGAILDQRVPAAVTNGQPGIEMAALGVPAGSAAEPKNPIGPVKGYPETGKDSWRAGNDDAIAAAASKYNSEKHLFPGDAEYMSPQLMKSWMMRESGGSPEAFKTDPFQVNNTGDWPGNGEKARIAGLSKGQTMTPETSAEAALKWMHYKGRLDEKTGRLTPYQGHYEGLRRYNAAPSAAGIPKGADYANAVLNNAWASYGDWQK